MGFHFDSKTVHFQNKIKSETISKSQPIYQTSAFAFEDLDDLEAFYGGKKDYLYTRVGNPNTDDLGNGVAMLEGASKGVATSSGVSAILAGVLSVVETGEHIVACEDLYGGTYQLLASELKSFGIEVSFVSFENINSIEQAIKSNTKLIYSESITNPLLRVEDLEAIAALGKKNSITTMIDNTFATPYLIRPLEKGIDLVVHSATKYIGGHTDVTAGVVAGSAKLIEKAKAKVMNLGCNLSPFEAWLGCRGLKTLSVRMERHVDNAAKLAERLRGNKFVNKVYFPNDASEKGNGAIVTIELDTSCDLNLFFRSLSWVKIVPTLAGVETSVSYPLGTSHRAVPQETRVRLGITENLVRISVGIEDSNDIITTFEQAVEKSLR
jgi:cystathionine beta-lyase/cystathionine gamma-synthase